MTPTIQDDRTDAARKQVLKFRDMADRLTSRIADKRREMTQRPTPKRMREYRSRLHDADNLKRKDQALRALADAHERGDVPASSPLARFKTGSEIGDAVYKGTDTSAGYYEVVPLREYHDTSEAARALQALIEPSPEEAEASERRQRIAAAESRLLGRNIPGFFPTPAPTATRMVELAEIEEGAEKVVLEPSAGTGDLVDVILAEGEPARVVAVERNTELVNILRDKFADDQRVRIEPPSDFLAWEPTERFDAIVMNPPFESGQALDHVRHAYELLKPGGRLVSVLPESVWFRTDRKHAEFRQWADAQGGFDQVVQLSAGAFRSQLRTTEAKARLILIQRSAEAQRQLEVEGRAEPEIDE